MERLADKVVSGRCFTLKAVKGGGQLEFPELKGVVSVTYVLKILPVDMCRKLDVEPSLFLVDECSRNFFLVPS